jgi:2-polyprenyl-3-methyl-5-hydroxy-6-metoxy-1,4-benzoquinol methylase
MVNEKVYDEKFYKSHIQWSERYIEIAQWLCSNFKPKRVIDFGCGNGFIISELKKCGASVIGVEGSANAIRYTPQNIKNDVKITDVTEPLTFGKYDLVISSEVAEHLPEKSTDVFIDNLSSHANSIIDLRRYYVLAFLTWF